MVPNGWEKQPVNYFGEVNAGRQRSPKFVNGTIRPYLRVANVFDAHIRVNDVLEMYFTDKEYDKYQLIEGDILLNEGQSIELVGRPAMYVGEPRECCFQNTLVRFRANDKVDRDFALQRFRLCLYDGTFQSIAKKTTSIAHLGVSRFAEMELLWPPLPEQRKIAKILSTWDKAITTTEKLIETSKQQKKALMQQLLTGKKRLVNPDTGRAFEGEWEEVNIGDICSVKGGKRLPKGESLQVSSNNHPYIRVADMFMGGVDCSNILYVPEHVATSISKYTISTEDLFITVAGTLGLVGKIPPELDGANLTENADKLTDIVCNQTFLMYVLMSPVVQKSIDAESTQNAQPKLALSRIRGFKFLLPDNSEQQKIASVLTAADKEIEIFEAKLVHFKQEKKALMQQLLTGKRRVKVEDAEIV
ncbi:restriction endonuclease subunit S [Vibrio breoganii]